MRDLKELPLRQQVEVAAMVHRMNPSAAEERRSTFAELHSCLSEEDGRVFEEALASSRRLPPLE